MDDRERIEAMVWQRDARLLGLKGGGASTPTMFVDELLAALADQPTTEPRAQKCPVCDGTGHLYRPPWVPGDQASWSASNIETHPCRACAGTGVLWPTTEPEYEQVGWVRGLAFSRRSERDTERTDAAMVGIDYVPVYRKIVGEP